MEKIHNITKGQRGQIISLSSIASTVLAIENEVKIATFTLHIVSESGAMVMIHQTGEGTRSALAGLSTMARDKALSLIDDSVYAPIYGTNKPSAGGASLPNSLTMTVAGFPWYECKLTSLWISYEMGWLSLTQVRDIANERSETVAHFMRLFRYFTLLAHPVKAA